MGFADDDSINELKRRFPNAVYINKKDQYQERALSIFNSSQANEEPIGLHLKGTSFQMDIWKRLLQIPFGRLVSYSSLAGDLKKARATGTAIGDNPAGYLIPCHRVVRATGEFGHYYWGTDRKAALISWEAAVSNEKVLSKKRVFKQQPVG